MVCSHYIEDSERGIHILSLPVGAIFWWHEKCDDIKYHDKSLNYDFFEDFRVKNKNPRFNIIAREINCGKSITIADSNKIILAKGLNLGEASVKIRLLIDSRMGAGSYFCHLKTDFQRKYFYKYDIFDYKENDIIYRVYVQEID